MIRKYKRSIILVGQRKRKNFKVFSSFFFLYKQFFYTLYTNNMHK